MGAVTLGKGPGDGVLMVRATRGVRVCECVFALCGELTTARSD